MNFGVPKETRDLEMRVGLTPPGVLALVQAGHTVYVEQELLYDPADQEETRKVFECIREVYRVMVLKYGAVHTIPNRSFLDRVALPSYSNLIRGIKKLVDPNGIMMAHGPYSFEQAE